MHCFLARAKLIGLSFKVKWLSAWYQSTKCRGPRFKPHYWQFKNTFV